MRLRITLALLLAAAAVGPAAAQTAQDARGAVRTETQERLASGIDYSRIWDFVGLIGLLGLLGLRPHHTEDSYHPAALE